MLRIAAISILAIAIAANVGLAGAWWLTREPAPRALTADRVAKASKPAVVLVQANYTLGVSYPRMTVTGAAYFEAVARAQLMRKSGQVRTNAQAYQAEIDLVLESPNRYFSSGASDKEMIDLVATGSGFFVNEDGYLVTAAQVVSPDQSIIRRNAVSSYSDAARLTQDNAVLARALLTDLRLQDKGIVLTPTQTDELHSVWLTWIDQTLSLDKVDVQYHVGTGAVQTGSSLTTSGIGASVVSIDATSSGHDIAIMKADVTGVPALRLGTAQPHLGQPIYALGYPRQGYLDVAAPLDQTIVATVSAGTVSGTDRHLSGWTAGVVTGTLSHGDSGGPVLDATGGVIGVVSYSQLDSQGRPIVGGGFFVPSQYVADDLSTNAVTPAPAAGSLTETYYKALAEGDIQRYKPELVLLEEIQSSSPFDIYVKDDIAAVQGQVLAGNDRTPPDFVRYVPAAAVGATIATAIAFGIFIGLALTRRQQDRVHAEDTAPIADTELLPAARSSP